MSRITRFTIVLAVIISTMTATAQEQKRDFALGKNIEILANYMYLLQTQYVDKINPDDMLLHGTAGITSHLDPYTVFMSEKETTDFKAQTSGHYGGMGAVIRKDGDYVIIAEPYKNSPADRAGIIIGDKIIAIDGKSAKSMSIEDVSGMLRGEPNTIVNVTIERLLDGKRVTHKIRRERISIPSIPYAGFISNGVAYIKHTDFTENCYDDMRTAILELQKRGKIESLILDYRNNGGGLLLSAANVLSLFVPKNTKVVDVKERDGKTLDLHTMYDPLLPDTPITVLINQSSASAAEIVAGAIQDLDRGVVIGERSFGKGLVQSTLPTGYNTSIKITTGRYYTPSGRCIQALRYDSEGRAKQVPDSLITEFRTVAGRKVYDGGGIMPDIKVKEQYMSTFLATLYLMGIIEDYVDEYYKRHHTETIDVRNFSISDADYAEFITLVEGREVPYKSESMAALEALKKSIKQERLDVSNEALKSIEQALKVDNRSNLTAFRAEITQTINAAIVQRYAYMEGVVEHNMMHDHVVAQAVKTLSDKEQYRHILTKQDTSRK